MLPLCVTKFLKNVPLHIKSINEKMSGAGIQLTEYVESIYVFCACLSLIKYIRQKSALLPTRGCKMVSDSLVFALPQTSPRNPKISNTEYLVTENKEIPTYFQNQGVFTWRSESSGCRQECFRSRVKPRQYFSCLYYTWIFLSVVDQLYNWSNAP